MERLINPAGATKLFPHARNGASGERGGVEDEKGEWAREGWKTTRSKGYRVES